jgi:hypothetical protein
VVHTTYKSGSKPFGLCGVANGIRDDLHGCAWVKDANIGAWHMWAQCVAYNMAHVLTLDT